MYSNSFWDTIEGHKLAANISLLAQSMSRKTKQKTFRFSTATELALAVEDMIADGWKYINIIDIGIIDSIKEINNHSCKDTDCNPDRYLLIMEKEI